MIIRYPTGLYESQLPQSEADPTSVVFTISNLDPARSDLLYNPIPPGEEIQQRPARVHTDVDRRAAVAELVFVDSTVHHADATANGQQQYVPGELLNFSAAAPPSITLIGIPPNVTQHDVYRADVGLDQSESAEVAAAAVESYNIVSQEIVVLQQSYTTLQSQITSYQKDINDTSRYISGLDTILAVRPTPNIQAIKDKLVAQLAVLQVQMDAAVAELNALPAQIQAKKDELVAITTLVQ